MGKKSKKTKIDTTPLHERLTWVERLFAPVDIATLVFFRVVFGLLNLRLILLLMGNVKMVDGRTPTYTYINRYFMQRDFNFKYYGFGWVEAWPGDFLYWHFAILAVLCVCIALGLFYRASMSLFCLGFTYVFLLEQARFMNHYYLICLFSMIMVFVPANRAFSLDAYFRPHIRSQTTPAWTVWLLRFQFGLVYFYAGIAKLDMDWLSGATVRLMMARRGVTDNTTIMLMSYSGLLFDLLIVPLLLWRRTRLLALIGALIFNVTNSYIFEIDIFPWFMIAGTLLFFSPDWPRKTVSLLSPITKQISLAPMVSTPLTSRQRLSVGLLWIYVTIQVLLPLRHHFYEGNTSWTNEGHYFAWRMLLRVNVSTKYIFRYKCVRNGKTEYGRIDLLPPSMDARRDWQYGVMLVIPDMILQVAHWKAERLREKGCKNIDIRAIIFIKFNGRPEKLFVDKEVNLANEPRRFITPYPWVLPLKDEDHNSFKSPIPAI
jgi:vitamin K-dependent gamma-carboxylase